MKIVKILFVAAIALGMVACNNDTPDVQKKDGILTVNVFPGSDLGGTRLTGDLTDPGNKETGLPVESIIKSIEVWVFAGGNLEKYQQGTTSPVEIKGLTVGSKTVVVVANGNIGSKPNLTTLQAVTKDLSQNIANNGMLMTAEPVVKDLTPCLPTNCNTMDVAVTRVNARVAVVGVKTTFDTNAPYKKFELAEVAMFNVRKTTNIFGTSLLNTGSGFLFGSAYPSSSGSYVVGTVEPTLLETLTPALNVTATPLIITNSKYFYVHENDATAKQETFLVLKGKLFDGADNLYTLPGVNTDPDGYTYYKVMVNANKSGYTYTGATVTHDGTVLRNTQYNIDITLTKAGTPTIDEPEASCLEVAVTVKPWIVVNQNVNW